MKEPEALGTLIRSTRLDKGLSLGQLASAVGRSSSSVRRWERGESAPAADVLDDLARALDLDAGELAEMAGISPEEPPTVTPDPTPYAGSADGPVTEDVVGVVPRVHTTIEDEEAVVDVAQFFEPEPAVEAPIPPPQDSRYRRASSMVWGRRDSWIGWVRGFLTLLALFFLFMGLIWALGELLTALGDAIGTFGTGG